MEPPAVESALPPAKIIRAVNPLMKRVLRSPLYRLLPKGMALLTVTGRRSGRRYTVPVTLHPKGDGTFLLSASGNWRHNLRGGADVQLVLGGRQRPAHAVLEEDGDRAAEGFKTMIDAAGPRPIALKVNVDRSPTVAEIKPAIADRALAYVRLTD